MERLPQIVAGSGDFTIQIFERLPQEPRVDLRFADLRRPEDVARATEGADAVIVDDEELREGHLEALADTVRIIGRCGTGLDSIDLDAAARRGVSVLFLPAFAAAEVADHTVALILASLRRLPLCGEVARSAWHDWRQVAPLAAVGDTTIGLVGAGRIGRAVIERLRPFGPELLVFDAAGAPEGATQVGTLNELLAACDVVSLHVPLTPETLRMIGARELALMKPGAILVNVARGGVVDEPALVEALREGRLGGAALDVAEDEPAPSEALLTAPRTILSPHVAWQSDGALARARDHTLLGVAAYLRGEEPAHGVFAVDAR